MHKNSMEYKVKEWAEEIFSGKQPTVSRRHNKQINRNDILDSGETLLTLAAKLFNQHSLLLQYHENAPPSEETETPKLPVFYPYKKDELTGYEKKQALLDWKSSRQTLLKAWSVNKNEKEIEAEHVNAYRDILCSLVKKGGDLDVKNRNGQTARDILEGNCFFKKQEDKSLYSFLQDDLGGRKQEKITNVAIRYPKTGTSPDF